MGRILNWGCRYGDCYCVAADKRVPLIKLQEKEGFNLTQT